MRICMLLHKSVAHDSRVRREASALAAAGHDVTVVELDADAAGTLDGFARVSASPPAWVRRALPFHLYRAAFLAWFLARVVRLRPDAVHAHDAAMLLPGLLGARLTRARLVYDSHELATGVPYREGGWARFVAGIERVAVPRAAAVITVSDGIAARLRERYRLRRQPVVVRNVCALRAPAGPSGVLRAAAGDGPLILHQGAAAPDRGCETLVRALRGVPGATLVFLGDEGEPGFVDTLRALAAAEGVAGRVVFLPSLPVESLLAATAEADVGVSLLQDTSENHRLALPNKVFEYLAAGVPVVVSDLPELAALVREHGVGWTVRPDDPDAVAAGLRAALGARDDDALRARVATAADALSWSREAPRLLGVYAGLEGRRAMVLVRNTAVHDARVGRAVGVLAAAGWAPQVVGVQSTDVREAAGEVAGAPLVRLDPGAGLRRRRHPPAAPSSRPAGPPSPSSRPPGPAQRLRRLVVTADFYRQGLAAVRAGRPALLHCNDWNTMWIGVAAKPLWRTRVVYDAHELWADRNGRPEARAWIVAAEALFVRAADVVITASPGYAAELATRYRIPPPAVVRNVPEHHAATGRVPAGDNGSPPTLAYVGGLLPGRGLEQPIAAVALVPGVRLTLIGPGDEAARARLSALAAAHGVGDRVERRPPVAPEAVVGALAGATAGLCLIQPICRSYELTLPNKLYEYVAAGLPVLASDLPVIGSVVREHGIGELAPPEDVEAVAAALRRLLEPGRREQAAAASRRLAETVTWATEQAELARAYARALA
jgi:glycosyltransferase involved in cell wall biosynthesis